MSNKQKKQNSTPKAVTFPKKNELPRVGLEPTCTENTSGNIHCNLILLYMYATDHGVVRIVVREVCEDIVIQVPGDLWAGISCEVHKQVHRRVVLLDQRVLQTFLHIVSKRGSDHRDS